MDKYMKRSFTKLRTALAILIACCLTTDMYAQTAVAADSVATDTVAQLVSGVNTVWMLLAAMLVFFMQPGFALVEAGFYPFYCSAVNSVHVENRIKAQDAAKYNLENKHKGGKEE